ncbi:hypothetical protein VTP01DRAFT_6956 [Rhizomucor pusillus]|uniref:uncharacterized protein n=1 Tax=Rhizomucor pusillus TaxID=4840 RepID=UPI003743EA2F
MVPVCTSFGNQDYGREMLLATLPTIILMHLSLERLIPIFEKNRIDVFRFLSMNDAGDFVNIGICNPDDCRRLVQCVRSIQAHMNTRGISTCSDLSDMTPSLTSLTTSSSASSTSSSTCMSPTTPTSPSPNNELLDLKEDERQSILRAVEAFDRYALPSSAWSPGNRSSPLSKPINHLDKGKTSVRSSFMSVMSESTIAEEDEDGYEPDPPPYPEPSQLTCPESAPSSSSLLQQSTEHQRQQQQQQQQQQQRQLQLQPQPQFVSREGRPGTVVPRKRNLMSRLPRPLSMPAYFANRLSMSSISSQDPPSSASSFSIQPSQSSTIRPASPTSTITADNPNRRSMIVMPMPPPPDYLDTTLMKRWEKCRSLILPREEEGKEELPPYKCTVYKMGHVHLKREMDAPGVRSRWRVWRKLYVEVWGTILRIYRAAPNGDRHSKYYSRLGRHSKPAPLMTLSLAGAEAGRAWDYTKRPHSLRLTTAHGPQMLLRLPTHVEMISWIEHLQAAINISLDLEHRPMPKFMTLPTRTALTGRAATPRMLDMERAREQRRREQREMLI